MTNQSVNNLNANKKELCENEPIVFSKLESNNNNNNK